MLLWWITILRCRVTREMIFFRFLFPSPSWAKLSQVSKRLLICSSHTRAKKRVDGTAHKLYNTLLLVSIYTVVVCVLMTLHFWFFFKRKKNRDDIWRLPWQSLFRSFTVRKGSTLKTCSKRIPRTTKTTTSTFFLASFMLYLCFTRERRTKCHLLLFVLFEAEKDEQ